MDAFDVVKYFNQYCTYTPLIMCDDLPPDRNDKHTCVCQNYYAHTYFIYLATALTYVLSQLLDRVVQELDIQGIQQEEQLEACVQLVSQSAILPSGFLSGEPLVGVQQCIAHTRTGCKGGPHDDSNGVLIGCRWT